MSKSDWTMMFREKTNYLDRHCWLFNVVECDRKIQSPDHTKKQTTPVSACKSTFIVCILIDSAS